MPVLPTVSVWFPSFSHWFTVQFKHIVIVSDSKRTKLRSFFFNRCTEETTREFSPTNQGRVVVTVPGPVKKSCAVSHKQSSWLITCSEFPGSFLKLSLSSNTFPLYCQPTPVATRTVTATVQAWRTSAPEAKMFPSGVLPPASAPTMRLSERSLPLNGRSKGCINKPQH